MSKRATDEIREVVARALAEDLGPGDVTSDSVIPADAQGRASIVQKEPGVLFGLEAAAEALRQTGAEAFDPMVVEGQWRDDVPALAARVAGPARALLAGERVALNLLGHLSGIATLTARVRPGHRGNRRPHPRHAEDHPRPARAREGRGRRGRGRQPQDRAVRRDPDQGQPRRDRRRGGGGGPPRARRQPRAPDRGRVQRRRADRRGGRGGSRPAAARQLLGAGPGPRGGARRGAGGGGAARDRGLRRDHARDRPRLRLDGRRLRLGRAR